MCIHYTHLYRYIYMHIYYHQCYNYSYHDFHPVDSYYSFDYDHFDYFSHGHTNISLMICGADICLQVASARTSNIREALFETFRQHAKRYCL